MTTQTSAPSKLGGVFAPICTPFAPNEDDDFGALQSNLGRYATTPLRGYLTLGSNGENRSLSEDERRAIVAAVVRHRGPDKVVLAGAAYDGQREAERFLEAAADAGADFGLVLAPGYFRTQMTVEVLYRYFSTLADASPIPLLLYNAPGFSGITLSPELVGRLASHPRIVGMKVSVPDGVGPYLPYQGPEFQVLAGSANFLFPAMLGGSAGGTVSLANAFPDAAHRLYEYGLARDEANGAPCQAWLTRVNHAVSGAYGVAGVKAAMDLAGYVGGPPRRPLLALEPAQVSALRELLVAEGLLS